jgi:hypothetical protein
MAGNDQSSKLAAAGGVSATIAAVIAAIEAAKARAGPGGQFVIPPELLDAIAAIAINADATNSAVQSILEQVLKLSFPSSLTVKGWPSNTQRTRTIIATCLIANRAYQSDYLLVPDGMSLLIRSHPFNAVGSLIYVATNAAEAITPATAYPLQPSEVVLYQLQDAHNIYVSSTAAGSVVIFSAEQE